MGPRLDGQHHLVAAQDAGHGVHAAGHGLAQDDHVGADAAPVVAEQLACAGDAGLDLVADEEGVGGGAEGAGFVEVGVGGEDDACVALDGLDDEGGEVGACGGEGLVEGGCVVVGDWVGGSGDGAADVGDQGAVVVSRHCVGC